MRHLSPGSPPSDDFDLAGSLSPEVKYVFCCFFPSYLTAVFIPYIDLVLCIVFLDSAGIF